MLQASARLDRKAKSTWCRNLYCAQPSRKSQRRSTPKAVDASHSRVGNRSNACNPSFVFRFHVNRDADKVGRLYPLATASHRPSTRCVLREFASQRQSTRSAYSKLISNCNRFAIFEHNLNHFFALHRRIMLVRQLNDNLFRLNINHLAS